METVNAKANSPFGKWLTDDKTQPKKQRHTAVRIYRRLKQEHDFLGAETTVRKYVKESKLRLGLCGQQAFIPCEPTIGGEAEVDWGTCHAIIDSQSVKLKHFCMRSKYSDKHFVCCYPCERQQALFDGHIEALGNIGITAIPTTLAVSDRLGRKCIGIEKDPKFIDVIKGRLSSASIPAAAIAAEKTPEK